jgi:hypothetical protein
MIMMIMMMMMAMIINNNDLDQDNNSNDDDDDDDDDDGSQQRRPTNEKEDLLAVVWSLMQNCTHGKVKINENNGDHSWHMHGYDYLGWILGNGVQPMRGDGAVIYDNAKTRAAAAAKRGPPPPEPEWKNLRPVNKYVHPVMFDTGSRKKTLLQTKIKRRRRLERIWKLYV